MPTTQEEIEKQIHALVGEKFYPCIAAVQSVAKGDYVIETAEGFGQGRDREKIRSAILKFIEAWKAQRSTTLSLWIVYPEARVENEEIFEATMWNELSRLTSVEESENEWAKGWSKNPEDRDFTLCIGGHAFFVVGVHPRSSRKGRRFPYPALIFNVFDQFQDLQKQGVYNAMVAKNRERDQRYHGSVNPMAEAHGETWETIQFSGRNNSAKWKCPFHFLSKKMLGT